MSIFEWVLLGFVSLDVVVYVATLLIGRAYNRTYRERLKIEKEEQEQENQN